MPSPKFSEPQSRVQISGSSCSTCGRRSIAADQIGVGPNVGSSLRADYEVAAHAGGQVDDDVDVWRSGCGRPPRGTAPGRGWACRSRDCAHGYGRRWRRPWPPRAPRRRSAAASPGSPGCLPTVSPAPVTAQVTITRRLMSVCRAMAHRLPESPAHRPLGRGYARATVGP